MHANPVLELTEIAHFQGDRKIDGLLVFRIGQLAPHNRRRVLGNGGRIGRDRSWLLDTVGERDANCSGFSALFQTGGQGNCAKKCDYFAFGAES